VSGCSKLYFLDLLKSKKDSYEQFAMSILRRKTPPPSIQRTIQELRKEAANGMALEIAKRRSSRAARAFTIPVSPRPLPKRLARWRYLDSDRLVLREKGMPSIRE
jgi:hypothetical protein